MGTCQSVRAKIPMRKKSSAHARVVAPNGIILVTTEKFSERTGKDYLTTLPAELLLKIIPHLPLLSFFDLAHTSRFLRYFLKVHASVICNEAIKSYFPNQIGILQSEKRLGWLVPTHEQLRQREEFFSDVLGRRLCPASLCEHSHVGRLHCKLFDPRTDEVQVKISEPGPQYLFFLQRGFLQGGVLYWYQEEPIFIFRKAFNEFMKEFNHQVLCDTCVRNGKLATSRLRFPRELLWYYGSGEEGTGHILVA